MLTCKSTMFGKLFMLIHVCCAHSSIDRGGLGTSRCLKQPDDQCQI